VKRDAETPDDCVMCDVVGALDGDAAVQVVHRGDLVEVLLNLYPYTNGHMLVLPKRHVAGLDLLSVDEHQEIWSSVRDAVAALTSSYAPDGVNVGVNQGRAAGAGVPGHVHVHVLPRWAGDTSFTTSVAGTRVIPETLDVSGERLRAAWLR
jgi:ATP adenylyltransferase